MQIFETRFVRTLVLAALLATPFTQAHACDKTKDPNCKDEKVPAAETSTKKADLATDPVKKTATGIDFGTNGSTQIRGSVETRNPVSQRGYSVDGSLGTNRKQLIATAGAEAVLGGFDRVHVSPGKDGAGDAISGVRVNYGVRGEWARLGAGVDLRAACAVIRTSAIAPEVNDHSYDVCRGKLRDLATGENRDYASLRFVSERDLLGYFHLTNTVEYGQALDNLPNKGMLRTSSAATVNGHKLVSFLPDADIRAAWINDRVAGNKESYGQLGFNFKGVPFLGGGQPPAPAKVTAAPGK
jgi:hypothetical protein